MQDRRACSERCISGLGQKLSPLGCLRCPRMPIDACRASCLPCEMPARCPSANSSNDISRRHHPTVALSSIHVLTFAPTWMELRATVGWWRRDNIVRTTTVPARDGGRVSFLPSMAAAPLSLASTESGRLGPHRRAAQAGLEHVAVVGVRCCRGECVKR